VPPAEAIESFVATNIDELSEFDGEKLKPGFRRLLEKYHGRVNAIELDESTLIDVPPDLDRCARAPPLKDFSRLGSIEIEWHRCADVGGDVSVGLRLEAAGPFEKVCFEGFDLFSCHHALIVAG